MIEKSNSRTLICSVVFLDIVEYSRQPVSEQIRLKDRFNALLSQALQDIAVTERIVLDTGDGAAISMIGDPEDALHLATNFRDAVAVQSPGDPAQLRARIGINLGPVRLVKDINGQPNIVGDGINVAQRVMAFAQPGQALVSRSYYEVVSRLSDDYSELFQYEGSHTDKHVREHEVYAVGNTVPALRQRFQAKRRGASRSTGSGGRSTIDPGRVAVALKNNVLGKPWLATSLAIISILVPAMVVRVFRDKPKPVAVPRVAVVPAPQPSAAAPPAETRPAAAMGDTGKKTAVVKPQRDFGREKAVVALAITPWGEVYVDGIKQGVSPPLHEVRIVAGEHKIEVRNPRFPSHFRMVNAKAGEQIRIRHKFR